MILIYIPCSSEQEAEKVSLQLLNKKLVKCVNLHPIKSLYWWKGKIEKAKEVVILAKARDDKFEEVREEVEQVHSYDTPCILSLAVKKVNERYKYWIETPEETK